MVSPHSSVGSAPRPFRLLFWLILGGLSTALAEVPAGSDMLPFFHPWGILVTTPLYALHILVLATLVLRLGRPRPAVLYFAGVLFGLYEAYITKVLWYPPWGEPAVTVGGVGLPEFLVIAAFWHPLMAFILPLLLAEVGLTSSREILGLQPPWVRGWLRDPRRVQVLLAGGAVALGAVQSGNSPDWQHSLASGLLTGGLLLALCFLWRERLGGQRYTLRQLLPTPGEFWILVMLLSAQYFTLGPLLRPEALPGWGPQAMVWACYAVVGLLLWRALRHSRTAQAATPEALSLRFSLPLGVVLVALFTLASIMCELALGPAGMLFLQGVWACGAIAGLVFILRATSYALQGEPPPSAVRRALLPHAACSAPADETQ